jgi:epoxyqueuosine reductase
MTPEDAALLIKARAKALGFGACGLARAEAVDEEAARDLRAWLDAGCAAGMDYMHHHQDLRLDPRLLQPGAQTLIVTALNYYPEEIARAPLQCAYYAYGADYHYVIRGLLNELLDYIRTDIAPALLPPDTPLEGRAFTDSAPLMERYWAVRAGLGFIGRNRLLILPGRGSYYFLGTLAINLPLPPDRPLRISCGTCRRCLDACPTGALQEEARGGSHEGGQTRLDARRCISYQTIENRTDDIPADVAAGMGSRLYGCDACQQACPWNRFARPTTVEAFRPLPELLHLDAETLRALGGGGFKRLFRHSAMLRAGYKGLLRNLRYVEQPKQNRT